MQKPGALIVDVIRALQVTRLRVEALYVSCWILPFAFASELVNARDFLYRQAVPFRVIGNREWAEIIGENQGETLPVLLHHWPNDIMIDIEATIPLFLGCGMDYVCPDVKLRGGGSITTTSSPA